MLSLIGIGLNDEKDITVKGLEKVKAADYVYLENYTSKLQCSLETLEKFYGKAVVPVEREFVEDGTILMSQAGYQNIVLLIIGDVFSATTHIALTMMAKEKHIDFEIINNASVMNAIGITGLELYKFGKTTSIPFHESNTAYDIIKSNKLLHTLCLLDLVPKENKFMEASEAIEKLEKSGFNMKTKVVVCAQLGSKNPTILYTEAKNIKPLNIFPQCLIIPGDLHFIEKEALEGYSK
ncbi:diphthine synthase [Candidatus Woesearchaeota archaeon]|nr:diphthine synthase [Candidatus Woesearchaeota archaeon]